jgi:peptidoglycan/xylan/chitin deacetylase (PgdA/CDA1 family)
VRMKLQRLAAILPCCAGALLASCTTAAREHSLEPAPPATWTYDQGGVVRGDVSARRIALIFTGGDYGEGTGHILDTLQAAGIKASFFVTGTYSVRTDYAPLLRRIVAEGHYLGPHSAAHLLYCAWEERAHTLVTEEAFRDDLRKNIAELREFGALRGPGPIYFIPPYEWFNADQVRWARDMGVTLFNFTPGSGSNRDWIPEGERGFVSSETLLRDILACERRDPHGLNGFLLLLHLGSLREDKLHVHLGPLLDALAERGYAFVRVDELLAPAGSE